MLQAHRQERRPAIRDSVVRKVNAHLESGQRPKNKSKARRKTRVKWVRVKCGRLLSPTYGVFFNCLMIKTIPSIRYPVYTTGFRKTSAAGVKSA